MFSGASSFVEGVDMAFFVIIGISLVFLIGITFGMVYFSIKYNKKKHPKAKPTKENAKLEIIWTVIPTLLVLGMFYFGWVGYRPMKIIPKGAIPIKVTGKMWSWSFEYENGKWDSILYVPINKPVKLDLYSPDVNHSLYIPAFRIKQDIIPGIANQMWFQAEKLGDYNLFCAEYCGLQHSYMISKVKVLSEEDYTKWYNTKQVVDENMMPGELLIKKLGCFACHSTDGTKLVGPSFKGTFNTMRKVIVDGKIKEVKVDETYLINSITNPNTQVVEGYPKGLMTNYKDQISEEELQQIVDYLKSLK
ncbi:MAG: cytochrome c oxidase subunit II [Bacteroidales bacterium]|nr:cytochrome c oxidase subunit II [Bacteroidales bacterium]